MSSSVSSTENWEKKRWGSVTGSDNAGLSMQCSHMSGLPGWLVSNAKRRPSRPIRPSGNSMTVEGSISTRPKRGLSTVRVMPSKYPIALKNVASVAGEEVHQRALHDRRARLQRGFEGGFLVGVGRLRGRHVRLG